MRSHNEFWYFPWNMLVWWLRGSSLHTAPQIKHSGHWNSSVLNICNNGGCKIISHCFEKTKTPSEDLISMREVINKNKWKIFFCLFWVKFNHVHQLEWPLQTSQDMYSLPYQENIPGNDNCDFIVYGRSSRTCTAIVFYLEANGKIIWGNMENRALFTHNPPTQTKYNPIHQTTTKQTKQNPPFFNFSLKFSLWMKCVYFPSVLLLELLKSGGLYLVL